MKRFIVEVDLMRNTTREEQLAERARTYIPGGAMNHAKEPRQDMLGYMPWYIERAEGCYLYDIEGREFIDYSSSYGPVILGYRYPPIEEAVRAQMEKGVLFSMPSPLEGEWAEMLANVVPCAQMARAMKTGSAATAAAVRVARAATGREKVISCGYNSWHDWWVAKEGVGISKGIPSCLEGNIYDLEYGNLAFAEQLFQEHGKEISCLITIPYDFRGKPCLAFLRRLRSLTKEYGAVLIFDEIITGFRLSLGGAQELFEISPDMCTLAKAMGNGYPLSAYAGKADLMKLVPELQIDTTYAGEALSLAASLAVIREMRDKPVLEMIWHRGEELMTGLRRIFSNNGEILSVEGLPPAMTINPATDNPGAAHFKNLFIKHLYGQGVFYHSPLFVTFSHTEKDIECTLEAAENAVNKAAKEM
jgi:glutamate-1-semialdehyde 2,1-aminomutase